jgi:hypothetical protein
VFETSLAVFIGVALILIKLPRRWLLRALKHDIAIDLAMSVLVLIIHWGTFSGVMATTIAGLLTNIATSGAKRLIGYIDGGKYYPGFLNI